MKVRELIEQLSKLEQDAIVLRPGYEGGYDEADLDITIALVEYNPDASWWWGKYDTKKKETPESEAIRAYIL